MISPVDIDKITTFEISKLYLHIFNFLCFIFSMLIDFEYLQIIFLIQSYIINEYILILKNNRSYLFYYFFRLKTRIQYNQNYH